MQATTKLSHTSSSDVYRRRAPAYDISSHSYALMGYRLNSYRRRGLELLQMRPGDTVVEVGCGTGANFSAVEKSIGSSGRLIGVDLSEDMLAQAQLKVSENGWSNVELINQPAGEYEFPENVAAVFSTFALTLVPDFDEVIRHAAAALRPGGRFVVVDFKAPTKWPQGVIRSIVPLLRPFGVTLDLQDRHPWKSLAEHMNLVAMEERYLGTTYIAVGEKNAKGAAS